MNATNAVERVQVMGGDRQFVSQVGLHLLGDLADRVGLSSAYSAAVPWRAVREVDDEVLNACDEPGPPGAHNLEVGGPQDASGCRDGASFSDGACQTPIRTTGVFPRCTFIGRLACAAAPVAGQPPCSPMARRGPSFGQLSALLTKARRTDFGSSASGSTKPA